ncbi:MAG: hypothetical protein ABIR16_05430 [Dokdonella sp.]
MCQLNEYMLETLTGQASIGSAMSPDVVTRHADLWRLLDPSSRRLAAQIPVLLLDLNFLDEAWWRGVTSTSNTCPIDQGVQSSGSHYWQPELTRQVLMLAWPTVREDRVAASLLFGMSDAVAAVIGSLTPQQLDRVSLHYSDELRLRWAQCDAFWRGLLTAALSADAEALRDTHLFGIQLLGGERMRAGGVCNRESTRRRLKQ